MRMPKFRPRHLDDEMPLVMRNVNIVNPGAAGINIRNVDFLADGISIEGGKPPIRIKGSRKAYLRNLNLYRSRRTLSSRRR